MHEQAFVNDIVAAATAQGIVEEITVEVGELAPIAAAELEHALSMTGWKIKILGKQGTVSCSCGFIGSPIITDKGHDYTMYHCPKCKQQLPPILDGKDIVLKDVTVQ